MDGENKKSEEIKMTHIEQFQREYKERPYASKYATIREYKKSLEEWKDKYIEWLEKQIPQWISVKDILPDDSSIIDIMYLSGDIRHNVRWRKMFEQNNLCGTEAIEPVTHWRVHVIQPSNIKRGMEAEP